MSVVKNPVVPPAAPKRKFKKRYVVLGLFAAPLLFGMFANDDAVNDTSVATAAPAVVDYSEPLDNVSLKDYDPRKGGFGSVMLVDFKVANLNPYAVKDFELTCTHYAPSGTVIDSNTRIIYEVIPANDSKKVKDFNMGFIHSQAASSSCEITSVEKQ